MNAIRPGYLYYYDGLPAWTVRVPQPSRFRAVETTLEFRPFLLPSGGLLACILRLFDVPSQPFYVHRVFDLSEAEVARYLKRSRETPYWVVEIKGGGQDADVLRIVALARTGFDEGLKAASAHNKRVGRALDGAAALARFLEHFEPASESGGWEAGWEAVAKALRV